jgi:hypothetical protein
VRFSRMSPEEACERQVHNDRFDLEVVCLRRSGHDGACMTAARDAAKADRCCFYCRAPFGQPHQGDCYASKTPTGLFEGS